MRAKVSLYALKRILKVKWIRTVQNESVERLIFFFREDLIQTFKRHSSINIVAMTSIPPVIQKTYGSKKNRNVAQPISSFGSIFPDEEASKQRENTFAENVAKGIGDSSTFKNSDRAFTTHRIPIVKLEKAIRLGTNDDLLFLISQTEGEHSLLGFFQLGFVIPPEWDSHRQNRCRTWLMVNLGFQERIFGNTFAYTHINKVYHAQTYKMRILYCFKMAFSPIY